MGRKTKDLPADDDNPQPKKKKTPVVRVFQEISDILSLSPWAGALPPFPRRYYAYSPSPGARVIVRSTEEEGVVEIVPPEALGEDVIKYTVATWLDKIDYNLTSNQAKECVKYWLDFTKTIATPKPFGWPGEAGLFFRRLPWPRREEPMPTWNKLLGQMSNATAFCQWLGSLFFDDSYLQQYVWAYGVGNDGKGSINRFLEQVFGPAYCSKQPRDGGDKFWTHGLLGRRLVVFPDCNDARFITGSLFKSLTGNDPVSVEAKGEMAYTTRLTAKYMVISNSRPSISSEKSDGRRIIYCEFQDRGDEKNDEKFEEKLWEEGGSFLDHCIRLYETLPSGLPIEAETLEIQDWVETIEAEFEEALDYHFELKPTHSLPPIHMQRIIQYIWRERRRQLEFLAWLERRHGVRKKSEGPRRIKTYQGIRSKPEGHMALLGDELAVRRQ